MFGVGVGIRVGGTGVGGGTAVVVPVATAATNVGSTSFTANWNVFSGANYYLLDVSLSSSFSTFVLQDAVAVTNSYNVTGLTSNTTYYYRVRAVTGSDSDAMAFVNRVYTAGGVLSYNEVTATNQLVLDLKSYSIWTKMKAIYPMVGASAAACAQNLVSSSFTGTFNGGWTYASTGVTPNGTNGYMDTKLNSSTVLGLNNTHVSVYLRTDIDDTSTDIGNFQSNVAGINIYPRLSNLLYVRINDEDLNTISNSSSKKYFIASRISSTNKNIYINNVKNTITNNSVSLVNNTLYLGALNDTVLGARYFSQRQNAFASIGDGLTDTEASNLYTAVQAMQVSLSRNV